MKTEFQDFIKEKNRELYDVILEDLRGGHIALFRLIDDFANQSKWISAETMPDYDGRYLCFVEQKHDCGNTWKYCGVRDFNINIWSILANETITHWQPLPKGV